LFAILVTFVVGLVVSALTGLNDWKTMDHRLFFFTNKYQKPLKVKPNPKYAVETRL
jgi:hypothetical protein